MKTSTEHGALPPPLRRAWSAPPAAAGATWLHGQRQPAGPGPGQRPQARWLVLVLLCTTALGGCVVAPLGHPRYPRHSAPPAPPMQAPAAAPLYFYPERGQPETVQDRDRFECYRWAVRETGTDPGMTAVRSEDPGRAQPVATLPRRADASDVVAGAATGAWVGAVVSSPRHAGAHIVLGALFGAVVGAANGEARNRAIDDEQARQAAAAAARARLPLDNFRRAMTACMQGRGYRVQ